MVRKWALTAITFLLINSDFTLTSGGLSKLEFLITNPLDPELYFNAIELICNEGYPAQQHSVTSEDGYIINMHRIPNGNRKERGSPKRRGFTRFHHYVHPDYYNCVNESLREKPTGPPVLMQHGLLVASDSWVLRGAGHDLAYLLADAGFDVWLSDARGNYYSRSHLYKNTNSKEFWDFSFHEMGYYDIPALIDYILATTNHRQLYYIGHSMGTVMMFAMGATRPEYMSKIRLATLLAPVTDLSPKFLEPPLSTIFNFVHRTMIELSKRDIYEFAPRVNWLPLIVNRFCSQRSPFQDLCYDIGLSIDGHPYYNLVRKNFARIVSHALSGASVKTFFHFIQMAEGQSFRKYDYGEEENFRRYHQSTPPEYNVTGLTCPVALIYSEDDTFQEADKLEETAMRIPNVVFMKRLARFIHTDFIIARNAKEVLYDDVVRLIQTH